MACTSGDNSQVLACDAAGALVIVVEKRASIAVGATLDIGDLKCADFVAAIDEADSEDAQFLKQVEIVLANPVVPANNASNGVTQHSDVIKAVINPVATLPDIKFIFILKAFLLIL